MMDDDVEDVAAIVHERNRLRVENRRLSVENRHLRAVLESYTRRAPLKAEDSAEHAGRPTRGGVRRTPPP